MTKPKPTVHLILREELQSYGKHRGKIRYRKHLVLGCGKAVAGGLRSEKAAFARHTTSVIACVTCRQCAHEWGVQIRPKDPPPPPKPVFNDPWSSEDAPLGATQWPKNGSN